MSALVEAGHRVVCVTATRGEAADPEASAADRAELARIRTTELESALGLLGVTEHQWMDYADGHCAEVDPDLPAEQIMRLLEDIRPHTVVTFGPDGFTGHPDHRAVGSWVARAMTGLTGRGPRLLHPVAGEVPVDPALDDDFGVFALGRPRVCAPDELAVELRLEGAALDRKVSALVAQTSQTAPLVAAAGLDRFRAWVATERLAAPVTSPTPAAARRSG